MSSTFFFETVSQWPGTCPLAKLFDQQNPRTHYFYLPALEFKEHNTSLNLACWYWEPSSVPHVCVAKLNQLSYLPKLCFGLWFQNVQYLVSCAWQMSPTLVFWWSCWLPLWWQRCMAEEFLHGQETERRDIHEEARARYSSQGHISVLLPPITPQFLSLTTSQLYHHIMDLSSIC